MSTADEIIHQVFGSEYGGLDENPVRVRAVVSLTDPYFDTTDETAETMEDALRNSFDQVDVEHIERVETDTDPTTGIEHYPGVED